jgi:hypothetical protein
LISLVKAINSTITRLYLKETITSFRDKE